MRTNKACPKFVPDEFEDSLNVGLTEREEVSWVQFHVSFYAFGTYTFKPDLIEVKAAE